MRLELKDVRSPTSNKYHSKQQEIIKLFILQPNILKLENI